LLTDPFQIGAKITITNASGGSLFVFPPSGQKIGQGATNASRTVATVTTTVFEKVSSTQWYAVSTSGL
jgi:hypothetical protein